MCEPHGRERSEFFTRACFTTKMCSVTGAWYGCRVPSPDLRLVGILARSMDTEQLLTRANVDRARGNYERALEQLREALNLDPENAQVRELMGDVLRARGEPAEAFECYRGALEFATDRRSVEEKLAVVSLDLSEIQQRAAQRAAFIENPELRPKLKSVGRPVAASIILPGLGQIYQGEWGLGVGLLLSWCLAVYMGIIRSVWAVLEFLKAYQVVNGSFSGAPVMEHLNSWGLTHIVFLLVLIAVALLIHSYAILNAGMTANRLNKEMERELGR